MYWSPIKLAKTFGSLVNAAIDLYLHLSYIVHVILMNYIYVKFSLKQKLVNRILVGIADLLDKNSKIGIAI